MAAIRLMKKWGVPLATGVSVPLFGSGVCADSGSKDSDKSTSRMIRPSELPIYEEPDEIFDFEYYGRERTSLEEAVGSVRKEVEGVIEATRSTREKIVHVCETGKAHTMATVDYITDEDNIIPRAGAITIGGLAGLVLGARKKGGLVKKVLYTSTGVAATASLCYPRQAYQISQQIYVNVKDYANIGYNFVAGVKPQSKSAPPDEPKKEEPKEPAAEPSNEIEATPSAESTNTPTQEAAPIASEPEGEEVRSVLPQALPDEKLPAPFDSLAQQSSDVMMWGFRLTDKPTSASSVHPDVVPPAEPAVPEGFGSVSSTESKDVIESIAEKVTEEIIKKSGEELVEEAAEVVSEVAQEIEVEAKEVAEIAKVVEEVSEKSASIVEVVKDVVEAADKAAHETPGMSETVLDVAKEVVEEVENIIDTVNVVAEKVEEVAEEIAKEAEDIKTKALDLVESEEKREEFIENVIDFVKEELESESVEKVVDTVVGIAEKIEEVAENIKSKAIELVDSEEKREELVEKVMDFVKVELSSGLTEETRESGESKLEEKAAASAETEELASVTPEVAELKVESISEEPVQKEGLFDKLISLFNKDDEEKVSKVSIPPEEVPSDKIEPESEAVKDEVVDLEPKIIGSVEEAVLPALEMVVEEIAEKVGEVVVEKTAEVIDEISKEVEEETKVLAEVAETVQEVGDQVASALKVADEVAEAAVEAAQAVPGLPDIVKEKAEVAKEVFEEAERVVDTVMLVAEEVKEVADEIHQEAELIDIKASELIESPEKREELIENVVGFMTDKLQEKMDMSIKEAEPIEEKEDVNVDKPVEEEEVSKAGEVKPVEKEGLVDKLISLITKKEEIPSTPILSEEKTDAAEAVTITQEIASEVKDGAEEKESEQLLVEKMKAVPPETSVIAEPKEELIPVEEVKELVAGESVGKVSKPEVSEEVKPIEKEGLVDKLINLFKNDEKDVIKIQETSLPEETKEEPTVAEAKTEMPVPAEEKELVTNTFIVEEPAPPISEEIVAEVPEVPVKEEEVGLFDKLVNIFSSEDKIADPIKDDLVPKADVIEVIEKREESVADEALVIIEKVEEELPVELKETVGDKSLGIEDLVIIEKVELPPLDVKEDAKETNVERELQENRGLISKLTDLFSKDEKAEDTEVAVKEDTDSEVQSPLPAEVTEQKETVAESPEISIVETVEKVTEEVKEEEAFAQSTELMENIEKSEGLFDKLVSLISSSDDKREAVVIEPSPQGDVSSKSPVDLVEAVDDRTETVTEPVEAEVTVSPDIVKETQVEEGGLFAKLGSLFTTDNESVEVADEPASESIASKSEETVTAEVIPVSESEAPAAAALEEPVLEVKDESLFSKLTELVSSNDKKPEDPSVTETEDVLSQEMVLEPAKEAVPEQKAEADTEVKVSLFDRVVSMFSKDSEPAPTAESQTTDQSTSHDSQKNLDTQSEKSEDDQLLIVISEPSTPVPTGDPEEGGQQTVQSSGWLQGSWFRSSSSLQQDGKDVIIQVGNEPEKDYGQSNPEDSDMYTTRS